ncbi:MAG: radical SAM protein [Candidatus Diapherotrites archaeon]
MEIVQFFASAKVLQICADSHIVETGYFALDEHILCLSCQVGCPLACRFCASGKPIGFPKPKSFERNLSSAEIVEQARNVINCIPKAKNDSRKLLFSYAGSGEPFLNYANVLQSIRALNHSFPNSRTTIFTTGVLPRKMRTLAREDFQGVLKLHLSLHAPNDALRKQFMPNAGKIKPALEALNYFSQQRHVRAKVNYSLIQNVNDSEEHALELAELLQSYSFTVTLSCFNTNANGFKPSTEEKFLLFEKMLKEKGIPTERFRSSGTELGAGCGQLKRHFLTA